MEYAGSPFEIKQLSDSGSIEGLLAGFGDVDLGGDRLLPGCLSKSLAARSAPLPMLFCHDLKRPIGSWKSWEERGDGLYVKGSLTLATRDGQEAYALAKDGALGGLSIGWEPVRAASKGAVREVAEAKLHEGSLVPVPMHERARVTAVKSITGPRDIAELLSAAGLSSRRAKAAAGAAWKAINEQPDEDAANTELVALIQNAAARLAKGGR